VKQQLPLLEELWKLMQQYSSDEAARKFCERYQCSRNRNSADWKFFFSVPKGGHILEIGAGFGDDTADLIGKAGETVTIVPNIVNALIVNKHLHKKELTNMKVAVMQDITHLPLADASIAAIAMEDAAASGFHVTNRNFSVIAAEWRRIMMPNGTVFFGLSNPYDRLLGLRFLRSKLQVRAHPESLNRFIKKAACESPRSNLRLRQIIRCMIQQGFNEPIIYAPFPDEKKTEFVLPIGDAHLVRYFLNNLIKRNSLILRVGISVANMFGNLRLFRYLSPYYFLIFNLKSKSKRM